VKKILIPLLFFAATVSANSFTAYLGPHFNYAHLKFDNPDKLNGYLGGISAGVGYEFCDFFTLVDFEGSWSAEYLWGDPGQKSRIEEYFVDGQIGYNFVTCSGCFSIAPYSGFGWDRFSNWQNPNETSLHYRYDTLFVPAGCYLNWMPCPGFQLGLRGEWRFDVHSRLHMDSEQFDNKEAYGARAELPVSFSSSCLYLQIVPFFDYAKYGGVTISHPSGATLSISPTIRWYYGLRAFVGYTF
jgi:hypothetical protein